MFLSMSSITASRGEADGAMDGQPDRYDDYRIAIRDGTASIRRWNHRRHSRRRFHRAFFRWYEANEHRFLIKLELLRRTDRSLEIGFSQMNLALGAWLSHNEIQIVVSWAGTFWDFLRDFETFPKRVPGGYVCDQCPADTRTTFATRQALWHDEVFEPFLQWINGDLARASALSISGTAHDATWAKLIIDERPQGIS